MQNALDVILLDVIKDYCTLKFNRPDLHQEGLIESISKGLDNIPYPIIVSDVEQFKPAYLNKACRGYINISTQKAKEFDNRFYYQYVHNDSIQIVPLGVSHFMNQPHIPYHVCYKINQNNNTHRWIYLVTHTLDYTAHNQKNIKYMISAFIDIHDNIIFDGEKKELNPLDKHIDMVLLLNSLTERERNMLSLICNEYTNEQIAEMMKITHNTVKTYRQKIMIKLGVKSGIGLGKFGLINELLPI